MIWKTGSKNTAHPQKKKSDKIFIREKNSIAFNETDYTA